MTLAGSVALVSGASSGIGAAVGRSLARLGASVSLVARRGDRLDALVAEITATGGNARAIVADVTDREQAGAAVDTTIAAYGQLDILVNNAGVMLIGAIENSPVEEWEQMIALNLQALLYMTRAALPHLLPAATTNPRGVADIVNISSVSGRTMRAGTAVYSATKWGVGAFSEILRQEVTARGVRIGLVEPGSVDTELRSHMRPEALERLLASLPSGFSSLDADDIADAVAYMVTRRAAVAVNEMVVRPTSSSA